MRHCLNGSQESRRPGAEMAVSQVGGVLYSLALHVAQSAMAIDEASGSLIPWALAQGSRKLLLV